MEIRRKTLIAVDGSCHSLQAVNYVAAICSRSRVEVSLVHVLSMASEELLWQINNEKMIKSSCHGFSPARQRSPPMGGRAFPEYDESLKGRHERKRGEGHVLI
jgi:hypothetical protein